MSALVTQSPQASTMAGQHHGHLEEVDVPRAAGLTRTSLILMGGVDGSGVGQATAQMVMS